MGVLDSSLDSTTFDTCLLTSGALDHNSILMHSGQRCCTELLEWKHAAQKGTNLMASSNFLKLHVPIYPLKVNESLHKSTVDTQ